MMHRRSFLRAASLAATGLAASACGTRADDTVDLPGSNDDLGLAVQTASFETLTGPDRWLAFGVTNIDGSPLVEDAQVEVFLRPVPVGSDNQTAATVGPLQATFSPSEETGQGVWFVQTGLEQTGFTEVVAQSGKDYGIGTIQVVDPADSLVTADGVPLVPGALAVDTPTATTDDDRGYFSVCTQDPPCGMHQTSLDQALAAGRRVVLLFATPQFCQTAVCGPSVATLDGIRRDGDWGDTVFIHSEIYAEEPSGQQVAATPLVQAVSAWGLPSEPWLFTIRSDRTIANRIDGPMPQPVVRRLVEELTA
jgi:hypothetical protein